jgi:glycosyltransferase involved in cell wall biosynthesis
MILSILIPSLPKRSSLLSVLLQELERQIGDRDVEVLVDKGDGTTGAKRNALLHAAQGKYVAFIDDDDAVSHRYIDLILEAVKDNPDCLSLVGVMTTNGSNPRKFYHNLEYTSYFERNGAYYRPPNHLNVIRASIAKLYPFPDKTFGEDTEWAMKLCSDCVLRYQVEIHEVLYYYQYKTNK